ncbi:acyltransferase [Pedobacter ginsengisoli]|uniref:acyltransferase n=1 Tax=Pedobacter ginsengisoli TaxID=363852 RepID=UPI00254FA425|nr:DapH/DapD/GlmU-related protein [Pedobacter ginsengisoli]
MLSKFKYINWKKNHPSNIVEYLLSPCGWGLRIINFIVQKIFRINRKVPFMVHFTSIANGKISIGRNVARYFANSSGCYFQGINGIVIGDNTIFAPGVKVISANHSKQDYHEHDKVGPLIIGQNCWLGANSVLLPGVEIGNNVIVAAGSVVTKSFGSDLVIGGVPAKIIKANQMTL